MLIGIGKTTLVRKVVDELLKRKLEVFGFYTEEVRDPSVGKRTGFQVVTLEGQRGTLASIQLRYILIPPNY